uniref:myosin heavy chain, striated muscle-like n=1 Tax=Fragaria vesca subsp. vesca TaxID=101020 RepID=UPI0005C8F130|nr:PREDICTED: myosin heavy chain, striated muscle-like [Fragaria vesca subsp. vesca]
MDSDLEGIESRQSTLRKAYESANDQASSIMRFTLQWKELEEHIEFTKELFKARFEEVRKREVEIGVKEKEMEDEEVRYKSERDAKAMELHRIQRVVEEKQKSVDEMEKRFKEVEELVREKEVDGSLIRKCNEEAQRKLEWLEEQIRVKGVQLKYVQGLVEKQWKEYDLKEVMIREMIEKERDFGLLKKSMEEWGGRLEEKETGLRRWVEKLEGQEREIGAKIDEVNLIDKKVHECLNEVQLKEQQLYSLEKSLHVQSCGLQKKEKELEIKREQLDSNVVQKSADIHTQDLKSKENSHQLKDEELEDTIPAANNGNRDGRGLQLLMNQHLRRNNLMLKEIEDTLQRSPDPAKLVLDAMHGFYPSRSTAENNEFDLTVVRRSCTLLLEDLKRVSPKITPQLRGEAMKLAAEWKAKMNTDNWFEVLGLLLLIAAYGLSSDYNVKELESLVGIIAQHNYDTFGLCSALDLGAKAPDQDTPSQSTSKSNSSSINCSPDNKIEKPADSPLANIQQTLTNSQVLPNEHLRTGNQLMIPVVTDGSCQSLVGLAGKVLGAGIIQDLIAKKQLLEAVVLSCNLKLTDMFPPVPLLRECADGAISVLKGVIGCIKDYNLEAEYPSKDIELQLRKLECLKVDGQASCIDAKPLGKNAKKKRWRNQDSNSYVSDLQPPQQAKKKHTKCYYCNEPGHVVTNCPRRC